MRSRRDDLRSWPRRGLRRALLAAVLLGGSLARAQVPPAPEAREPERTALFREGKALAEAGNWVEAVDRFRRVVAIRSAPKALFTLGEAAEHAGWFAEAERSYESALADARGAGDAEVADAAEHALKSIDRRVPRVTLLLDDRAAQAFQSSAHATVDGHAAGLAVPTSLDPGTHAIRVEAAGATTFETSLHVSEGERRYVRVTLEARVAARERGSALTPSIPSVVPRAAPPERPAPRAWGPVILGGSGVVVTVVGAVVTSSALHDYAAASAQCPGGTCPSTQVRDTGNAARGSVIAGDVLMGVGALVGVGAAVWWWRLARGAKAGASATIRLDRGGGGAVISGWF